MRILILDSNKLFAAGIKYLLEALFFGSQVECATCYVEAAVRLRTERFALLVMEIGTTGDNGLCALKRARAEYPDLPILVLSQYPVNYYGPRAMRAGACGFIEKSGEPEQLLGAVQCVLKGKHYISPELADQLARGLGLKKAADALYETLSQREFQIFRHLALGESVTRIARAVGLSVKTVDTHRRRVFIKMGFETREQLARYAFEHSLIPSRRLGEQARPVSDAALQEAFG